MDNRFDELLRNITLVYTTGEKIRIAECIKLAKSLLLTEDNELNTENCMRMLKSTPLHLVCKTSKDIVNRNLFAIRYKDIAIEFHSTDTPPSQN